MGQVSAVAFAHSPPAPKADTHAGEPGYEWIASCLVCGTADLAVSVRLLAHVPALRRAWRCAQCGSTESCLIPAAAIQLETHPGTPVEAARDDEFASSPVQGGRRWMS